MKNALYVLRAEATSNSEKINPVALAVVKLRLSEGIRQSVSFLILIFFPGDQYPLPPSPAPEGKMLDKDV